MCTGTPGGRVWRVTRAMDAILNVGTVAILVGEKTASSLVSSTGFHIKVSGVTEAGAFDKDAFDNSGFMIIQ
jgi:hypothetical protein